MRKTLLNLTAISKLEIKTIQDDTLLVEKDERRSVVVVSLV